nr:hypothetical protein [uncultured Prevotella sp.]
MKNSVPLRNTLKSTRVLKVNQENPYKYDQARVKPAICRVGMMARKFSQPS